MKVYETIKNCTVSYREYDKVDIVGACPSNDFVLYTGDIIFIESAGWTLTENSRYYREVNKLTKIYHNKLVDINSGRKEWTWVDNLNVIDPKIDKIIDIENATHLIKDVTKVWVREMKLEELGV